jgi:hypothetical protein
MQQKAVVAYFEVLSRTLPAGTEVHNENLSQDFRSLVRDLNLGPLEYEAGR